MTLDTITKTIAVAAIATASFAPLAHARGAGLLPEVEAGIEQTAPSTPSQGLFTTLFKDVLAAIQLGGSEADTGTTGVSDGQRGGV